MGQNQPENEVFRDFLEFGLYVFLEIAYSDSLRQFLTYSWEKIDEKNLGGGGGWGGFGYDRPKWDFPGFSLLLY